MKILENDQKIMKQLKAKETRLEHIAMSKEPVDVKMYAKHEKKVYNAKAYIDELQEVMDIIDLNLNINLVPRPTFDKQLEKADYATMEFDGEFCKIAIVENYPFDKLWLIWTAAVESI